MIRKLNVIVRDMIRQSSLGTNHQRGGVGLNPVYKHRLVDGPRCQPFNRRYSVDLIRNESDSVLKKKRTDREQRYSLFSFHERVISGQSESVDGSQVEKTDFRIVGESMSRSAERAFEQILVASSSGNPGRPPYLRNRSGPTFAS